MSRSIVGRLVLSVVSVLSAAACASGDRATAPRAKPEFDISDGAHEGGTTGFLFLPPMVSQPTLSGTFDADIATLNPQIDICNVTTGPDSNCGGSGGTPAILTFSTTSAPAIILDPTTPQYQVNWDTQGPGFSAGNTYRLHVTAGASGARRELGFADMLLTATPGQAKNMETGDIIVLNDGRTLPIHFWIGTGIPGSIVVSAATPSVTLGSTDLITATVEDLHGSPLAGATVVWSVATTPPSGVADATQPLTPTTGQTGPPGTTSTTFKAGATAGTAVLSAASAGLTGTGSVTVAGLSFVAVSAGQSHTCGLTITGAAYCWGDNSAGELGNGSTTSSSTPVAVAGGLTFAALGTGTFSTCGLTVGGTAYCWGLNEFGQLGNGSIASSTGPVAVSGGLTFAALSVGGQDVCGLTATGAAYCWGDNSVGELGNGSTANSDTPVSVSGGLSFVAVTAGEAGQSCGVTTAGAAYCWGSSSSGQLGTGSTAPVNATPGTVSGGLTFSVLSAGGGHTCGLTIAGAAYCWGDNSYGGLGDGSTMVRITPVPVSGGLTFTTVSAGGGHSCGVTTTGAAYCWGLNISGQLGTGSTTNSSTPVRVSNP